MLGIQGRRLRGVVAAAVTFVIGLLVVPVAAQAGLGANASIRFSPDVVRVGGSGTGEITLTNGNDAPDTAATNTVCNAGDPCPTAAATETQGISVIASCQALGSGTTCPAAAADPDVFALSATATGAALSACATTIFDVVKVADAPTDFGRWRFTPRPGTSQVQLPGTGATCRIAFTYTVLKAPRDANPATPELETIQFTFHSQANPSVSPLLSASVRSSATQIILRAAPTIATVASANVTVGAQITDTATVSGRVNPVAGATVQFTAYGPNDAACTTSVFTSTVALSAGGTATSAPFTPSTPGVYRWRAIYSGDTNNDPAAGACNDPGESVAVSALPLPPPPPPPPAPPPPPPAAPAAPVLASPTISTVASSDVVVGGQITDTATVSGLVDPEPGLKVVFRLYGPDDASCATSIDLSTGELSAAGVARSEPFTVTKAGVYRWRAFYLGDKNNNPVSGACNDPRETVTVTESAITSVTFDTPPAVGETTFLNIVAIDPSQPVSGVQVNYGEGGARSGSTACATPGVRKTTPKRGKHTRLRVPYAFKRAGKHRVTVKVLSGACGKPRKTKAKTVIVTVKGRRKTTKPRVATRGCKDRFLVPTAATRPRVAAAVLCLVNVERGKHGRKPLRRSARLTTVALKQSTDMLRRKYFAHEAPNGPQFTTRLRRDGYRGVTAAENIAYGPYTAQLVVRAWMNSPEHRANILHPRLKFAGVGLVIGIPDTPPSPGVTYTMNFGGTST